MKQQILGDLRDCSVVDEEGCGSMAFATMFGGKRGCRYIAIFQCASNSTSADLQIRIAACVALNLHADALKGITGFTHGLRLGIL